MTDLSEKENLMYRIMGKVLVVSIPDVIKIEGAIE